MTIDEDLDTFLGRHGHGSVLFLTGGRISAESGIPTFRGAEGYWIEGSRHYQPMELATHEAFEREPDTVWAWYLHRRSVCRAAEPNAAHRALAELERAIGDRFLLVTQNVDGLHLRAGSSLARTYQIHGNIDFMRCSEECGDALFEVPGTIDLDWPRGRPLADAERKLLVCPRCGARSRPHVLWFDESYDEARFRFQSALRAARDFDLLVVVGTTGATNLPMQIGATFARRRAPMLVVNPEPNPFAEMAARGEGAYVEGTAGALVPRIAARLASIGT